MERPRMTIPRAVWRGDHSSEKFNLFSNQYFMEILKLAADLNLQNDAIEADLDKLIDSESPYPDNPYHPFQASGEAGDPIEFNLKNDTMFFADIHKIDKGYINAKEKAKFILRSLT